MKSLLCLITVVWVTAMQGLANVFYASPSGSASGDGTILHPWDLATALQNNTSSSSTNHAVGPGDTISLRGGTYYGGFTSYLTGNSNAPIDVRPYPSERVLIEATNNNITAFYIRGGWARYWGFEVWNSSLDRGSTRNPGLMVFGPGTKLINLVVHDMGLGIGLWNDATDSEIYGCVMYNNGYEFPAPGEGKAHSIYAHSSEPGSSIRENITFNGYGYGIHCYSELGEALFGFHVEGNVSFNAGILNTNPNYVHLPNFLMGGTTPMTNLVFNNNYGYQSAGYSDNLQLGYQTYENNNAIVYSNYFAGGANTVNHWTNLVLVDNTFAALNTYFRYNPSTTIGSYLWNSNQYFTPWAFRVNMSNIYYFSAWKTNTSFDADSTQSNSNPTNTIVFVRTNAYEPGRANIIVYNWGLANTVSVDVSSVLPQGAMYEVRNAQDFFGPAVVNGIYDGTPLKLPMTGLTVAKPVGVDSLPPPTGPKFNVFIVLPKVQVGSPQSQLEPPTNLHPLN